MNYDSCGPTTRAIRVAQDPEPPYRPAVQPLYQSATFVWDSLGNPPDIDYTRVSNPTRETLEKVIASLEGGGEGLCLSSGMAAISCAFGLLKAGDHLLVATDIYGGTQRLMDKILPRMGIEASSFDATQPGDLSRQARPNTVMAIYESPSNPILRICDVAAIAEEARRKGILTVFDNTFASPVLMNPLDLGVDIVMHSATKYISGHSDVVGGALVTRDPELRTRLFEYSKAVGFAPSPFDCWLLLRGVKTIELRVAKHCQNAMAVAQYLAQHPKVSRVNYPGLPTHAGHEIAKRQMTAFGGMVSFEVAGGVEAAARVAEATKIFMLAESLGGVESLLGYPAMMSHAALSDDERMRRGIPPTLLRLSVGIENEADLIADLDQALAKA